MTYMLLLNCALKLVEEIILYYDARSKKHQISKHGFSKDVNGFQILRVLNHRYVRVRTHA